MKDQPRVVTDERWRAAQHLVEDDAERVDVRAWLGRSAGDALRREVLRRADDAIGGTARDGHVRGAEIEELDLPALGTVLPREAKHVLGLDVGVDDLLAVAVRERVRDLSRDLARGVDGELALFLDAHREWLALQVLHH